MFSFDYSAVTVSLWLPHKPRLYPTHEPNHIKGQRRKKSLVKFKFTTNQMLFCFLYSMLDNVIFLPVMVLYGMWVM